MVASNAMESRVSGTACSRVSRIAALPILALSLLSGTGASAQAVAIAGAGGSPSKLCKVATQESDQKRDEDLYVRCGDKELFLGRASSFSVIPYDDLGSSLIDVRYMDNRRILLLTVLENGQPAAEDMTGLIGLASNSKGGQAPADWMGLGHEIAAKRHAVARDAR